MAKADLAPDPNQGMMYDPETDGTKLGEALELARRGYWVFPILTNRKIPLIGKKAGGEGFRDATIDEGQIRTWWKRSPKANIGIAAGMSGLIVADLDVKNADGAAEWAGVAAEHGFDPRSSVVVRTPSGGTHHYYRGTPVPDRKAFRPSVDIKSQGGYILAPGSTLDGSDPEGRDVPGVYALQDGGPLPAAEDLPEVPEALRDAVTSRETHSVARDGHTKGEGLAALLQIPPVPGERNDHLTRVVGHLATLIPEVDAYEALAVTINRSWPEPMPDEEARKTALSIWQTERGKRGAVELPLLTASSGELAGIYKGTEGFWRSRRSLQRIWQAAVARRAAPWATLGAVVVRVLASIPPSVVLPPIVGGVASLNTFVAMVGASGGGKGAAEDVADDLLWLTNWESETFPVGSGEGIVKAFASRQKSGELEILRTRVLFLSDEIDTMAALGSRGGATLMPILRSTWSGKKVGFQNADPTKAIVLDAHSYRACLVAGVQPGRAEALLNESSGGTPQRFLWFPTQDPTLTREDLTGTRWDGEQLMIRHPWPEEGERVVIPVPEVMWQEVLHRRDAVLLGEASDLDGHAQLARMKFAVALAVLDDRTSVNEEDWQLSGVALGVSNRTRSWMQQQLEESQRSEARQHGRVDGVRREASLEAADTEKQRRTFDKILAHVSSAGDGGIPEGQLWKRFDSKTRDLAKDLVLGMLEAKLLRKRPVNGHDRLFRE